MIKILKVMLKINESNTISSIKIKIDCTIHQLIIKVLKESDKNETFT